MNKTIVSLGMVMLLAAQGCQSIKQKPGGETAAEADVAPDRPAVVLPFAEPKPTTRELDEDLVYSYLVGEIAAHRGELRLAQTHYQHAAILARDAYAAERATRIGLHLKDYEAGLTAVQHWVELAPNDTTARQLAAILLLRNQQPEKAGEQLDALVRIADARGGDGFLQAASALSADPDLARESRVMQALHERHADDIRSLYALAVLDTAQRRFAAAEVHLRQVIRRKPDWEQPRVLLSRVLVAQDKRDQALGLLADSIDDFPAGKLLRTSYARMLVDAERYAEALAQFRALYALSPKDHEIAFGYAMLATQQERWDEARPVWQKLRGVPDRRDEASYYLAQIEEEAGNEDLAAGLFRSIGGSELRVDAVIRLAQLLGRSGRIDEAQDVLQRARIANPGRASDLYLAATQIVQKHGGRERALTLYQNAIDAYPDNHDLLYNRALYLIELDDFAGMKRDLERILASDPDHADALNALGYTLADRNERLDEAFAYITRALELNPDSAAILDSMGWVLYRRGELEQAEGYLRRALAMGHDDEIAAHLGEVLWVSGQRDAARAVWGEALQHDPDSDKIRTVKQRLLKNGDD